MDNFDEFEFKPITEGLGFHKKTQKPKLDVSENLPGKTLPHAPRRSADTLGRPSQFTKLGDEKVSLDHQPAPQLGYQSPMQRPLNQPATKQNRPSFQMPTTQTFIEEPRQRYFAKEAISVSLPSIFFDAVVVVGLTSLFLFAAFLVAKVDPLTVLHMLPQDPMTAVGLFVLVFSVIQGYLLIARSFFGSTLGEWAFEIEVGDRAEQESIAYPLRILLRSLVTTLTGLVLLPLISLITGEDVAGRISGVSLHRG